MTWVGTKSHAFSHSYLSVHIYIFFILGNKLQVIIWCIPHKLISLRQNYNCKSPIELPSFRGFGD